jgi:hypothetical protein
MPKLPLFEGQALNTDGVSALREVLTYPEVEGNLELIDELLDLHADPRAPMGERLIGLVLNTGIVVGCLANCLANAPHHPPAQGKRGQMLLEMHHWVLAHAEAAGFLPVPKHAATPPAAEPTVKP